MTLFPKIKMSLSIALIVMCCIGGVAFAQYALKQDYSQVYQDLLNFKDSSSFSKYGFGQGGPHHQWLQRVRALEKKYPAMEQIKAELLFGDLLQLGREYMRSKGAETEYT